MNQNKPEPLLKDVVIIDLTRVLAGPYCTQMLGDLGAEVIKVEMPGQGDDTRQWGPPFTESGESAYFLSANRNKRSLTLNLKSEQAIEILKGLIARADVLVDNFRTGTLERFGLDDDTLQQIRPGLIYATITGYGYTGPYADRPGYDFMVQAMGGLMSVTGPEDGEPIRVGIAIADLATGIFTVSAILAALYGRERTGQGQRIDMSLIDSQVAMMSYVASNYLVSGELPGRLGNGHPNIVPYQSFKAKDQHFAFAAGNDRQWNKFCEALGKTEWMEDERFATNRARVQNRAQVVSELKEVFATRTAREWMDLCEQIGIPTAPINDMAQVFEDPQVQDREMLLDVPHAGGGSVPLVASPLKIPTAPVEVRYPPPLLGQHTDEILTSMLGLDAERIRQLREDGVI
ncbi:MAG TPA: CoA transferase [Anaerolineales bacterium]|jgi:formyl-CoA transferase|nr:CoA transferase [Anaerolineales bacterium]